MRMHGWWRAFPDRAARSNGLSWVGDQAGVHAQAHTRTRALSSNPTSPTHTGKRHQRRTRSTPACPEVYGVEHVRARPKSANRRADARHVHGRRHIPAPREEQFLGTGTIKRHPTHRCLLPRWYLGGSLGLVALSALPRERVSWRCSPWRLVRVGRCSSQRGPLRSIQGTGQRVRAVMTCR